MENRQPRVLIVEDSDDMSRVLVDVMTALGYDTRTVSNAASAYEALHDYDPDLVLVDLTLPDVDGLVLVGRIRAHSRVPIVIVSGRGGQTDRVVSLQLGADDFLEKPFDLEELEARLLAVMRRSSTWRGMPVRSTQTVFRCGSLVVDIAGVTVHVGERRVELTPSEFRVLLQLAREPSVVQSYEALALAGWDMQVTQQMIHLVRVIIARIREKLRRYEHAPLILTHRSVGYALHDPSAPFPPPSTLVDEGSK